MFQIGQMPDGKVTGKQTRLQVWLAIVSVVGISLCPISGKSLWIDEALTAAKAMQPDLGGWWQAMVQEKASDLQMPLYMVYIWGYEKLFGPTEVALRGANLPWFVTGAVAFIWAFSHGGQRRLIASFIVLFCPFAWYCLDEARPYAMQLGASLLVAASLRRLSRDAAASRLHDATSVALFAFGIISLCGSSLLGMIWAGAALMMVPALLNRTRMVSLWQAHRCLWLGCGGILVVFAIYYLWTLKIGARASAVATTDLRSVLFVGYELLGFGGLGPGRLEIREAGLAALQSYLVWLAPYGLTVLILICAALLDQLRSKGRQFAVIAVCCGAPAAFILLAGVSAHFRVLGRHFTPLMPALLLLLTCGMSALWSRRGGFAKFMAALFCILSLVSCLSVRFATRHEKDNYRAAAAFAKTALQKGRRVWWNAAEQGAWYYGVPLTDSPESTVQSPESRLRTQDSGLRTSSAGLRTSSAGLRTLRQRYS